SPSGLGKDRLRDADADGYCRSLKSLPIKPLNAILFPDGEVFVAANAGESLFRRADFTFFLETVMSDNPVPISSVVLSWSCLFAVKRLLASREERLKFN
ncbi:unnamed protein product, partial [Didymodactylos carnosus]